MGGSLFYITAVNNNNPSPSESPSASNQLKKGLSLNDNWQLSSRMDSPSENKVSTPGSVITTPDQELPATRPELNDLSQNTFKEVATPNEKPTIVSCRPLSCDDTARFRFD